MDQEKKVILLAGPTASGKSRLALDISKKSSYADALIVATCRSSRHADATADESGVALAIGGEVLVAAGDAIHIKSNGEQTAATTADVSYVIRR